MDKLLVKNSFSFFSVALTLAALTLYVSTSAHAGAPEDTQAQVYVDSVTKWGAWELDIEPAAGGLAQADTNALKARSSKVAPRTNSFTAVAPQAPGAMSPSIGGTPTVPTITPVKPGPSIPVGNPGI